MKKTLEILIVVDACVATIFLIGYGIMEVLNVIFSNNPTFDLIYHIVYGGVFITWAPFLMIFIVYSIKILIQRFKK